MFSVTCWGRFPLKTPAKENVAPQMVLGHLLHRAQIRAAGNEHLPHFLLQAHFLQNGLGPGLSGQRQFRALGARQRGSSTSMERISTC